jgi:glycosyltransferase involved in cell wall biosynthesis
MIGTKRLDWRYERFERASDELSGRAAGVRVGMSSAPTVSIALATYNGARFLKDQLQSLSAQTFMPTELVVGDDGSTDCTIEIVHAFAAEAPFPVRIEQNPTRLNYADNFLKTALRCESKYVAFCDQDDVWLPEKLERCVAQLEIHNLDLCAHNATLVDAALNKIGDLVHRPKPVLQPPMTLEPWGNFYGFATVFRRDLLDLIPIQDRPDDNIDFNQKLAHDRWVYFLASTFGRTLPLADSLVLYRQHGQNWVGAQDGVTIADVQERFRDNSAKLLKHSEICAHRSMILRCLAARSGGHVQTTARTAADYWTRLEKIYQLRWTAAAAPLLHHRLFAIVSLLKRGAYAPFARGGLSKRALVKDILVALSAVVRTEDSAVLATK